MATKSHVYLLLREIFAQEAREVSQFLQGIHHSRKISHQQVNYSETVTKLSKMQQNVPVQAPVVESRSHEATQAPPSLRLQEYQARMSENIRAEREINERKRLYNREVGRKAVVNTVLAGTAPMPKPMLYPQKATHVQILAMTGNLKAPNPHLVPPVVQRNKKWLGDGVGWES